MNPYFRVTEIRFDENEEVAQVIAVAEFETYKMICDVVGPVDLVPRDDRDTLKLSLSRETATDLRWELDQRRRLIKDSGASHRAYSVWNSLNYFYHALMTEED